MGSNKFRGTGTALVTPFRGDGSIDFKALEKFVNFQIDNHVNYLVALGTTSEAATMSADEKNAVVDFIIEVIDGRLPLVVGCGGNNTLEVVTQVKAYNAKEGIDGLLSVAPYYNKPNQQGIYEHFKAIASASNLPIILYNVPGRTASNMSADTTVKLAKKFKNIVAVKEASGDFGQVHQIIKNRPKDFLVLSGEDAVTLPLIASGADGVISVVSYAYPAEFSEMIKLALDNEIVGARKIHYQLIDIIDTLFEEGNPAGVKAYLVTKGLIENNLRLPLVKTSKALEDRIKKHSATL